MIVLDASAAIELLLLTPRGLVMRPRVFSPEESLHAPQLLDIEIAHALRRHVYRRELTSLRAAQALEDLADLTAERHGHVLFLPRIWQLRDTMSAYDAAYISLAEHLQAPLLTCDEKLARTAGHSAKIELIK